MARYSRLFAPLLLLLSACGEEPAPVHVIDFAPPPDEPITLNPALRGITFTFHRALAANQVTFAEMPALAENVVVQEQIWSEREQGTSGVTGAPRFDRRIPADFDHDTLGPTLGSFARTWMVMDFQRMDRDWIVDWEGLDRDLPAFRDTLNFEREDLREDAEARVLDAFDGGAYVPDAIILGVEMERYYEQNPGDWGNWVSLVHSIRDSVHAAYPDVRVGAGINWSHFMDAVVPTFSSDGSALYGTVVAAWEQVIDPLYFDAITGTPLLDFYAFSSIPNPALYGNDPSRLPDSHFGAIPTLFEEEPARALPVSWFAVGWPIAQAGSQVTTTFLERFLTLNNTGYALDLVAWYGFVQMIADDCTLMTSATREIGAQAEYCYRGLFTPTGGDAGELPGAFLGR